MPADLEHGTYRVWEEDWKAYVYVWSHKEEVQLPWQHEVTGIQVYNWNSRTITAGNGLYIYLSVQPTTAQNTWVTILASNNNISWDSLEDISAEAWWVHYNKRFLLRAINSWEATLIVTSQENPSVKTTISVVITPGIPLESIDTNEIEDEYTIPASWDWEDYIPIIPTPSDTTNLYQAVQVEAVDLQNDGIYFGWFTWGGIKYLGLRAEPGYEWEYYYNIMVNNSAVKQIKITATTVL